VLKPNPVNKGHLARSWGQGEGMLRCRRAAEYDCIIDNVCYDSLGKAQTLIALARIDDLLNPIDHSLESGFDSSLIGLLSQCEYRIWVGIRHPQRRREWLAARLLVKHVFLTGLASLRLIAGHPSQWQPVVELVMEQDILDGAGSAFQSVELLVPVKGRAPQLFWCKEDVSRFLSCSISHSGGWVAAAFGTDCSLGVDIEMVKTPSALFKTHCFTSHERAWAEQSAARCRMPCDLLYTLLWTLKEATFKAEGSGKGFVWHTGVNVRDVITEPLPLSGRGGEKPAMIYLDLRIHNNGWRGARGVSCLLGSDCVMSTVRLTKGDHYHG